MADKDFSVKNGLLVSNSTWVVNATAIYYTGSVVANATHFVGTSYNTLNVGSTPASEVVNTTTLSSNLTNYQTLAGLSANVSALSYLVNTSSNFTVAGNLNFTGANNFFGSAVKVGSNVSLNTSSFLMGANVVVNTSGMQISYVSTNGQVLSVGSNIVINTTALQVTSNVVLTPTSVSVGNSTVNVALNTSTISVSGLAYGNNASGNKYISSNTPSGGANGDVWYKI